MARIYQFAEYQIDRKPDNHGWTFSGRDEKDKECPHTHLLFDENGHTVECKDCGKEVSAWWAFMRMVERYENEWKKIERAKAEVEQAEKRILTHKAAIAVEDAWRRRKTLPTCPHCSKPILPVDRFGLGHVDRQYSGKEAKPMELKPNLTIVKNGEPA